MARDRAIGEPPSVTSPTRKWRQAERRDHDSVAIVLGVVFWHAREVLLVDTEEVLLVDTESDKVRRMETLDLSTKDGPCRTQFVTPKTGGPWPSVILCFDAAGQRPAMTKIAERIASWGYVVAIPDLFHREGSFMALVPTEKHDNPISAIFADPSLREAFNKRFMPTATSYAHLETDIGAVLDALAARGDVRAGVGTTGYCMGGNCSFRIATIFGDRIAATAAFHPGGLVVPRPDSPHLRVGSIKSEVYLGRAAADPSFDDEANVAIERALTDAHVAHTIETYAGKHGYAVTDHDAYDAPSAEKHYAAMQALFARRL
jgi:carboxymethylenebutenolidase